MISPIFVCEFLEWDRCPQTDPSWVAPGVLRMRSSDRIQMVHWRNAVCSFLGRRQLLLPILVCSLSPVRLLCLRATNTESKSCTSVSFLCVPCHVFRFKMQVKELNTDAEILTVDRPCKCCMGSCKCCCYQIATISSGGQELGSIQEKYYYCIPTFTISDYNQEPLYILHQPTCCGGCCVNCGAEGNPCTRKGCCKVSFRVYPADQKGNTGGDQPYVGLIMKKPKSAMVEIFTDAQAFDIKFPDNATTEQKALLSGTAVFINANFFEGDDNNENNC